MSWAECEGLHLRRGALVASSIEEAIKEISIARPSVTLVDLFTANYDFQKLKQLVAHARPGMVIVVDDRVNPAFASLAKWAGAAGYLTKDLDVERFKHAITAAIDGGVYFPAEPSETSNGQAQTATRGLSARQLEVLAQLGPIHIQDSQT